MDNAFLFKPLYEDLLNSAQEVCNDIWPFFPQQGSNWNLSEHRVLVVGKATNGWVTNDVNVDLLFNPNYPERIVNRDDEMNWVLRRWGHDEMDEYGVDYNTKRSAFWRVIKQLVIKSERSCSDDNWVNFISWTNLYKISVEAGNPPARLKYRQEPDCCKILDLEQEVLKPKNVILFTSGWESFFFKYKGLENYKSHFYASKTWGDKHTTSAIELNGINYIVSPHPERKPETPHVEAILSLLK